MRTFASIRDRPTRITGRPDCWRGADAGDATARILPFGFDITDDGSGHYLLVCFSTDGSYRADTWHETLPDTIESASHQVGIRWQEWWPALDR